MPRLYQCHCSLCRKQSGSSSNTATIVGAEHFRWLAGQEHISSWVKDTGFRSDFCAKCGSPVPNPLRGTPYYWVPAGLLDGEQELDVAAHLFVGSKASWDVIAAPGEKFEAAPKLLQLISLLYNKKVVVGSD
jgi:hypothetical protein